MKFKAQGTHHEGISIFIVATLLENWSNCEAYSLYDEQLHPRISIRNSRTLRSFPDCSARRQRRRSPNIWFL